MKRGRGRRKKAYHSVERSNGFTPVATRNCATFENLPKERRQNEIVQVKAQVKNRCSARIALSVASTAMLLIVPLAEMRSDR